MDKNKTVLLRRIYRSAERLMKRYGATDISQVHIIAAFAELYLVSLKFSSLTEELQEALNVTAFSEDYLVSVFQNSKKWLKQNPVIPYDEVELLDLCYNEAANTVTAMGKEEVAAPDLLAVIMQKTGRALYNVFLGSFETMDEASYGETAGPESQTDKTKKEAQEIKIFDPYSPSIVIPRVKKLQNDLREKIHGQDEAVSAVVSGYFNAIMKGAITNRKGGPRALFLFAGAPGVGKTFLANAVAESLELPFCRFDMSSFSDKEAPLEFAGTDKVYKSSHEGLVTGFVRQHPNSILLFDEIEKAHINIIHLFLQILDAGCLKDSYTGENVSFKNTIIIMTTNAGKSLYETLEPGVPSPNRKTIINAITNETNPVTGEKFFPQAIGSRFATGNVILFNPLGAQDLLKIGGSVIKNNVKIFEDKFKISIDIDDNICAALLFAEGGKADARAISGRTSNFISTEIYKWMKFAFERDKQTLEQVKKLKIKISDDKESKSLFEPTGKQNILLFSENDGTYSQFKSTRSYALFNVKNIDEAYEIINDKEIAFAVCDIFGTEKPTLNVEDTESEGRAFLDVLIKEQIPAFVYCPENRNINAEERQALIECGARGFIEQTLKKKSSNLKAICKGVYIEKKLHDLGRSKKVLSFDCKYESENDTGIIELDDLRIIPAVDADDKQDIVDVSMTDVTFDSIIGAEDAKAELKGFISYLKEPRAYTKNKIPTPKGIVLYGPPGTGKTMLAKAFAHESGATFIATQGNNFLSPKKGGGANEVKRIFATARKYAPTVLFIDEFDIIAKDRFTNDIAEDVVNALLNEMDGFSTNSLRPVFVLAATNFDVGFGKQSALDAALLRRFDRRIFVDLPDANERKAFIEKRLKESKQKLDADVIKSIVSRSIGMSLAEMGSIIDFALRNMVQSGLVKLSEESFNEAFETFRFGERDYWSSDLLRRVAVHEAGHAFMSYKNGIKPSYITISARGSFGGYVQIPSGEDHLYTKNQLLAKIRMQLAGRASEIVFYGDEEGVSTGAAADIESATQIALQMITVYGMVDEFGIMTSRNIDSQEATRLCNEILLEELERAKEIIAQNKSKIDKLVETVMEKNHLMGDKIEELFKSLD